MTLFKNILSSIAIAAVTFSFGTVITVDNNAGARAQYAEIQDAIDNSSDGDTLLIKGSITAYANITLSHRLTLIGEAMLTGDGFTASHVDYVYFASTQASGSVFKSLRTSYFQRFTGFSDEVDNLVFESCVLYQSNTSLGKNWVFLACRLGTFNIGGPDHGLRAENCYMATINSNASHSIGGATIKIDNCTLSNAPSSMDVLFTNCIFRSAFAPSVVTSTNFSYCLFAGATPTAQQISDANASSSNCIFDTDPAIVNTTHFQLESFSPALGTGLGGEDIGVTGGNYPLTNFYGHNNLPVVTSAVMKTAVVKPGEGLIFEFSADQKDNLNE